jgi:tetratricopeptide (TPR) repeat protein
MRRDPRAPLKAKDWREVAFRDHASLVVFSTLSRVGDGYALAVHCEQIGSAPDPPVRNWDHTATVSGPDTLFEAVRDSASWIRKTAGENDEELSVHNKLPQDITSSSWEALELFEQAQEASASDPSAAIALLRRAIQLDPQFAMALMRLGDLLVTQRSSDEGYGYWKRAIEQGRAQHLSDRERLTIESRDPMEIGDFKAAEPVLRQWEAEFPNDPRPSEWLAATLISLGRFPEGVSIERDRRRKFPPTVFSTGYLIHGLGLSQQLDQIPPEIRVLEGMGRQADVLLFEGITAAVRKSYPDATRFFERYGAEATGPQSSEAVSLQAAVAADQGNFSEASRLLKEGMQRDKEAGRDGMGAEKASALAFIESIAGHKEQTRAWALESVSLLSSPDIVMQSSTLLARSGFISDARRIAARMPGGEGTAWEAARLRSRGELLAATGDYQAAIDVLERAGRLEAATRPREYLARAYALAGLPDRARIVYSRIVDSPWVVWVLPESEWPGQRFLAEQYLTDQKRRN